VPLCYIVCSCHVVFTIFAFLYITTSALLSIVVIQLLRLASSCESVLPGHALVSLCDLYCSIAAVRETFFITVIQETDA